MKDSRSYLFTVGALLVTLVLSCHSAVAGPTSHFKFTGLSANAAFDSTEGCVETFVSVFATTNRTRTVGPPEAMPNASVFISQFDFCSFTTLVSAFGSVNLSRGAFQIKRTLTSATLNTSIDVFDVVSNTTFPVDISLSWTGTGGLFVSRSHNVFTAPGFREISTFTGASRSATASGSVTAFGSNFAPNPAVFAELDLAKSGDLTITHP